MNVFASNHTHQRRASRRLSHWRLCGSFKPCASERGHHGTGALHSIIHDSISTHRHTFAQCGVIWVPHSS